MTTKRNESILSKAKNRINLLVTSDESTPVCFAQVLNEELSAIALMRENRDSINEKRGCPLNAADESRHKSPEQKAHSLNLLGLAFSGGGIRSATFNLGVLQALAKFEMLHCFDYLSTVSGGGYIGAWLDAWIKRHPDHLRGVIKALDPQLPPQNDQVKPIMFLREYSNYLTPKLGLMSADTWTTASIWMRNSLLNLIILVAGGIAVLLVPLLLLRYFDQLARSSDSFFLLVPTTLLFLISAVYVALSLKWFNKAAGSESSTSETDPKWVRRLVVLPTFVSAFLLSAVSWKSFGNSGEESINSTGLHQLVLRWLVPLGRRLHLEGLRRLGGPWHIGNETRSQWPVDAILLCFYVGCFLSLYLLLIQLLAGFYDCFQSNVTGRESEIRRFWNQLRAVLLFFLYPPIAGLVVGGVLMIGFGKLYNAMNADWGETAAMSSGTLLLLIMFSLVVTIHIGLMGRNLPDDRREWWGRLGAWCFIYAIGFAFVVGMSLYGPWLVDWSRAELSSTKIASIVLGWVGTTAAGVAAGRSRLTGVETRSVNSPAAKILQFFLKVAPVVFAIGLFLLLSMVVKAIVVGSNSGELGGHWQQLANVSHSFMPCWVLIISIGIAVLFSLTVDINEFSMHHFYKNRLVRCYLGASRWDCRKPNLTTGFDRNDDVELAKLSVNNDKKYDGPLHIINATLNLVQGENLAWQERKAASFFFTPLYSGYDIPSKKQTTDFAANSFRPTKEYAYPDGGIHVGTAIAISGAAANPNMGFHSSAPTALLMTVFDVRLGWWLGNPRSQSTWQRSGPTFGLGYLFKELFGLTNENGKFVNLSDGGHFENLGVYELVRRRCRFIVVCDAEEDRNLGFGGLGNAVRKCREDFGVIIDIDVAQIGRIGATNLSAAHCVVGTIKYPDHPDEGILVYLKASLTGDEPEDVLEYKLHHPEFPHQSTADQWFTESQFESYRQLGLHIAEKTFRPACDSRVKLETNPAQFFTTLKDFWFPPSADVERSFTRHAGAYDALMECVRTDQNLGDVLDSGFFPEIESLGDRRHERSAFYFCTHLFQLMENVYLDLNLEDNFNHPDNAGWIQVFRNWTQLPFVKEAWRISRNTYGQTFQKWCEQKFGLGSRT